MTEKDLEETLKDKVSPLLEETMEKNWGIKIPKVEEDITDVLKKPQLQIYVPSHFTFQEAKKFFKAEFIKKELRLHQGNVSQLAKSLDLDRRSIHRVIHDLEIDIEEIRQHDESKETFQEEFIDKTIRSALDQYKNIIQPHQMEKMYSDVPRLSRNIAKFLPHQDLTWKEAEREFEKQFFGHALRENDWNVSQTAKKLDIRVETMHRKVRKLRLKE
jgi:DNA-binding NtrC family response regulator